MAMNQTQILTRILEVTRLLATYSDLESYLQAVISAAVELTDSETASILEFDPGAREFYFKFIPWYHREATEGVRVPLDGSIAGWVFKNAQTAVVQDVRSDERHFSKLDELTSFETRSMICVPLMLQGKPVGVFETFNKKDGAKYSSEDALMLETLAALATAAIQADLLEESIQSSREEARELDRLKNEFVAITSHELRTPLGLILGHATFLREIVSDEHKEQVDTIVRSASRLKDIVETLSNVDNFQAGTSTLRNRKVSAARLVEDVASSFREMAAKKGVEIQTNLPKNDDLLVDIDVSKITVALSNIVRNAITFTNQGGRITLRGSQQTGFAKISVEDTGIGIPTKDIPMIFERFYQVESHLTRRHGGMGLGLSVARVMIEMHGGRIWVESEEGKGSTFTFLLPFEAKVRPPKTDRPFV